MSNNSKCESDSGASLQLVLNRDRTQGFLIKTENGKKGRPQTLPGQTLPVASGETCHPITVVPDRVSKGNETEGNSKIITCHKPDTMPKKIGIVIDINGKSHFIECQRPVEKTNTVAPITDTKVKSQINGCAAKIPGKSGQINNLPVLPKRCKIISRVVTQPGKMGTVIPSVRPKVVIRTEPLSSAHPITHCTTKPSLGLKIMTLPVQQKDQKIPSNPKVEISTDHLSCTDPFTRSTSNPNVGLKTETFPSQQKDKKIVFFTQSILRKCLSENLVGRENKIIVVQKKPTKLEKPMNIHKSVLKPHKCSSCQKGFKTAYILKRHMVQHTGVKSHKCSLCNKAFYHREHLQRHTITHTSDKPHICPHCRKGFRTAAQLSKHKLSHSKDRPHECPVCHNRYTYRCQLQYHMRSHTGEKPYKCVVCNAAFMHKSALDRHSNIHNEIHSEEKPFVCEVCGKAFLGHMAKKLHKRSHIYKKHTCSLCGWRFRDRSHLKRHMMVHTGEKPYKCSKCNHAFRQLLHLKRHYPKCNKPHKCTYCGKAYGSASTLKIHIRTHKLKDLHKCDQCGKHFKQIDDLECHKLFHKTGVYNCPDCCIGFSRMDSLKLHRKKQRCLKNVTAVSPEKSLRRSARFKTKDQEVNLSEKKTVSMNEKEERCLSRYMETNATHSGREVTVGERQNVDMYDEKESAMREEVEVNVSENEASFSENEDVCSNKKGERVRVTKGLTQEEEFLGDHEEEASMYLDCSECVKGFSLATELEQHLATDHYESLWPILELGIPWNEAFKLM